MNEIAIADQWLASSRENVQHTITAMREMIAAHDPAQCASTLEVDLAHLACGLAALCDRAPEHRDKIIGNYVAAIYELARARQ